LIKAYNEPAAEVEYTLCNPAATAVAALSDWNVSSNVAALGFLKSFLQLMVATKKTRRVKTL
jgi:hypothetical protein